MNSEVSFDKEFNRIETRNCQFKKPKIAPPTVVVGGWIHWEDMWKIDGKYMIDCEVSSREELYEGREIL